MNTTDVEQPKTRPNAAPLEPLVGRRFQVVIQCWADAVDRDDSPLCCRDFIACQSSDSVDAWWLSDRGVLEHAKMIAVERQDFEAAVSIRELIAAL